MIDFLLIAAALFAPMLLISFLMVGALLFGQTVSDILESRKK
jgi:hypothetical protein